MISYSYVFDGATRIDFLVDFEQDRSVESAELCYPDWLLLERHRCPECTVAAGSRRTCPAALALRPVVEAFCARRSFEQVDLVVVRQGIRLEATIPTQNAVRSLIELLLPLSACPILARLRPMAYLHTPLGTRDRTAVRFLGVHLIAQYLRELDGGSPDWRLTELRALLSRVRSAHRCLAERIREATSHDAAVNGLVLLDAFVDSVDMSIGRSLSRLRPLFASYLAEPSSR